MNFTESFVEAIPQTFLNLICLAIAMFYIPKDFLCEYCVGFQWRDIVPCTAYNLVDQSDYFYWITTFISIISSCNGVLKLLKKGPLRLIARNSGFKAQLLLFGSAFFFIVSKGLSIFVLVNSSPTYYVWWFLLILFSEVLLAFFWLWWRNFNFTLLLEFLLSKPSILLLSAFAPYSFVYESFNGREVITVSIVWTKTVFGVLVELSFLIFALLYDLYGTYRYDYDDNLSISDWDRIWIGIFFLSMKAFLFFQAW